MMRASLEPDHPDTMTTVASPPPQTLSDRDLAGAAWMLAGALAGCTIDAGVKLLQSGFDTPQIVLLRLLFSLPFVLGFAVASGGVASLRPQRWRWHAFRACCASGATFGFFYALGELPLVLAITIAFAAPLMIAALSGPFLGEAVGAVRWVGILVGFAGVLLALQPGSVTWHPAMLAALGSTLCWSLLALSARRIGRDEPSGAMVLGTMPVSLLIGGALALPDWVAPAGTDWLLFALLGICGASVHYCAVFAYRATRASVVAPMEYSSLIWAALLGWFVFAEIPTPTTLAGAIVIVAGGLVVLRARD